MGIVEDKLTELQTQKTALETAQANYGNGVEEFQIGQKRVRFQTMKQIQDALDRVNAQISTLQSSRGGRTLVGRGHM